MLKIGQIRALTAGASVLFCVSAAGQSSFTGIAQNIDGDSLYVGKMEVRLFGIDAPEWGQVCTRGGQPWDCGAAAADQLAKLVTGKFVRCSGVDTDEHDRTVARCMVGSVDVNRTMVSNGYAIAYRHFSTDYVPAEASAKSAKRGLWGGTFEMPSAYRRDEKAAGRAPHPTHRAAAAAQRCKIKGNRGPHGWIYHLPGMPYYEQTRAEQMFCTETQAQTAGYRKAKVR